MTRSRKHKGIFPVLIIILAAALFAAWYLSGKPEVILSDDGIFLARTERPLVYDIRDALRGKFIGGDDGESSPVPSPVSEQEDRASPAAGSASSAEQVSSSAPASPTGSPAHATAHSEPFAASEQTSPSVASSSVRTSSAATATGTHGSAPELDQNHAENSPLFWGNPSDSVPSEAAEESFLMEKAQFTISYNNATHNPNWVAWHLGSADLGSADRANTFRADDALPAAWYAVGKADYKFTMYGFDRGHICPSADRTASREANSETFLMTNMVPQAPDNNRIVWVALEKFEREMILQGYEAYIFAGPAGRGGSGDRGYFEAIVINQPDENGEEKIEIQVPAFTWKIILFLPEGDDDYGRVEENARILAACVPNQKGCAQNGSWQQYLCTVDYIEEMTGYDFFELLDDDLEERIESTLWTW